MASMLSLAQSTTYISDFVFRCLNLVGHSPYAIYISNEIYYFSVELTPSRFEFKRINISFNFFLFMLVYFAILNVL